MELKGKMESFKFLPAYWFLIWRVCYYFSIALADCLYFVICENGLGTTIIIKVKTVNFPTLDVSKS